MTPTELKERITKAFAGCEHPGDWCLVDSMEGSEPALLAKEFRGKTDWRTLEARFLDRAPDGFGSALSFFSDEAFRFYLPAFLIASIDDQLERSDPVFHLTHGLDDASRTERVNPRRYGERTWFEVSRYKFAVFTVDQARAIVAYLEFMEERDGSANSTIRQALQNYWKGRTTPS